MFMISFSNIFKIMFPAVFAMFLLLMLGEGVGVFDLVGVFSGVWSAAGCGRGVVL